MTVRMRQDLDEGLAAVAFLRGSSKSGLVSQHSAEQIRLERERDEQSFDAAVKEIRSRKEAQRRKKTDRLPVDLSPDPSDGLKDTVEQRRFVSPEAGGSGSHDRSAESISDDGPTTLQIAVLSQSLLTRRTKAPCDLPETHFTDLNLTT